MQGVFSMAHETALTTTTTAPAIFKPDTAVINASVTPELAQRLQFISDSALKNGVHVIGAPGSGKTTLLGIMAWQMLLRNQPTVIVDPTGGIVAYLIHKISQLPVAYRKKLWRRITYVDAGAKDYIVPSPLLFKLSADEELFETANRFPQVLKLRDPDLQSAPILGWNSLFECAEYGNQIAAALGEQIGFVADFIAHPERYKKRLNYALKQHPELQAAADYFRELMDPKSSRLREQRTRSFANKLLPFMADRTMLATFGSRRSGIDWEKVERTGGSVWFDFGHELDRERRQFKLIWYFRSFLDYIKHRGIAGRGREFNLFVDEISQMIGYDRQQSVMAGELEELISVLGRGFGVNNIIAHQRLSQFDETIQDVLMSMGTQIIGTVATYDDARRLAEQFLRYNPYWEKKKEPIWMSNMFGAFVVDYRTVEFSLDEQLRMAAEQFMRLPRFKFFGSLAASEGNIARQLKRLSIANMDRGQYPDVTQVEQVRALLRQKCGIPIDTLLAEIQGRQLPPVAQNQPQKSAEKSVKLKPKDANALPDTHQSDSFEPAAAAAASAPRRRKPPRNIWEEGKTHEPNISD